MTACVPGASGNLSTGVWPAGRPSTVISAHGTTSTSSHPWAGAGAALGIEGGAGTGASIPGNAGESVVDGVMGVDAPGGAVEGAADAGGREVGSAGGDGVRTAAGGLEIRVGAGAGSVVSGTSVKDGD